MANLQAFSHRFAKLLNPRHSLKVRLGLAIGGIALIFSILASLTVGYTTSRQMEANIGQSLAELAYQITDKLDRGMFERYRDVEIVASLDPIQNPQTPASAKRVFLSKLQSTYPDYAWIGLTNEQGKVLVSTGKVLEGKNASQRPWFQKAQNSLYVGDVHEALMLALLLPNPTGEPLRLVDVAAPVRDRQGNFRGVLGAHLSWTWAREVQKSLLQVVGKHNFMEVLILRRDGTVLLGPPDLESKQLSLASVKAAGAGQNGYRVETWSNGTSYLTGFAQSRGYRNYPGLGWLVLVRQKSDIAFAPARKLQNEIFTANAVLGVLLATIGWMLADRLAQPMLAIAAAADRIRRGNATLKIPVLQGQDEIAILSKSLSQLFRTLTQNEQALQASNEQLQSELHERTAAQKALKESKEQLRKAYEAKDELLQSAQEANRLKDEFLAIVSHELRTPLNAILGWASLLRSRKFDETMTAKALETIERNAKAQNQLIEDLLDVSRMIRGEIRLNMRPVELVPIIESAINALSPAAEAKKIRLLSMLEPRLGLVCADSDRLQQVVWNLLSNAIKFTPEGGRVEVRLVLSLDTHVEIQVIDTGKGISPEFLPHVFELFRQAESATTRTNGGLGLGLALVRQLVELHGGTVHAASTGIGQGATFTVKLPLLETRQGDGERARGGERENFTPSPLKGLQVLLVDDEADTREVVTTGLEQYAAKVTAAASVSEALEAVQKSPPDVLVSDIGMPGEDGYALIRKVRAWEAENGNSKIPAVAVTAYAKEEDRQRAIAAGFQQHIPKPVEPAELAAILARLVGINC